MMPLPTSGDDSVLENDILSADGIDSTLARTGWANELDDGGISGDEDEEEVAARWVSIISCALDCALAGVIGTARRMIEEDDGDDAYENGGDDGLDSGRISLGSADAAADALGSKLAIDPTNARGCAPDEANGVGLGAADDVGADDAADDVKFINSAIAA